MVAIQSPKKPAMIALEGVAAGQRAGHHHAEHGDPEELEALKRQGELAQDRREEREAQDAEQRAEPGARGGDAHGAAGKPLARQRIAVERGGGGGRRARDVEQDGAAAAAVDGADVDADEHHDRFVVRHGEGERGQQRDAHRGGEAGQRADDDAEEGRPDHIEERVRVHEPEKGAAELAQAIEHGARDPQGSRT